MPTGASLTSTFARFRFSSTGNLRPNGMAADGEVEDYRVQIYAAAADLCVNTMIGPDPLPSGGDGQGLIMITNFGPTLASNVILSNAISGVDQVVVQPGAGGA